ncbi:DUF2306 domain-containing protein [Actinomadura flavalba]|uniref:DUF2306 domain-containing protein n=1 Tax=Actinomadura flavalba TaxID=1120938 RepID=UPI001969FBB7|nr:DUF2306 domain-containing protein [Actinomadura flavalba]
MTSSPLASPVSPPNRHGRLGRPVHGAAVAGIVVACVWFLSYTLPLYIPRIFDPEIAAVRIAHGGSGILALFTAVVQILPGVRRRFPRVHRWNGRVYVFAGVIPSGLLLFGALFAIGNPAATASFFWGSVWIWVTVIAWRAVRNRDYARHRRWMAYSIAITLVAATNAIIAVNSGRVPFVSQAVMLDTLDWLPWVAHLAVAHWYVTRFTSVPYPAKRRRVVVPPPPEEPPADERRPELSGA